MGISIPRAATSVTTRMLEIPFLKFSTCIQDVISFASLAAGQELPYLNFSRQLIKTAVYVGRGKAGFNQEGVKIVNVVLCRSEDDGRVLGRRFLVDRFS